MENKLKGLKDKVAVVTGASSGLGVQFAKALAGYEVKLALIARREEKLKKVKDEVEKKGTKAKYYTLDITDAKGVNETVDEIINDFGRIDILVNNAGMATVEPMEEHSLDEWRQVVDTNLTGVFLLTKYVGKEMVKQKYGRIINISSMYGAIGNTYMPASSYHATKGAVNTFTRAVSAEWAPYNITVNAIAPGFFLTEMTEEVSQDPEFERFINNMCPKQRMGEPGELDGALLLFASDLSSYITGQVLYVDGGWTSV